MSDVAIGVENLSKRYRLGEDAPHRRLTGALAGLMGAGRRPTADAAGNGAAGPTSPPPHRPELWALRDVSFEVQRGEVLGIIGKNGAGKSTLLKILSRITEPTAGRAVLHGRVSSLLEVGTGFHEELTGRENIYLNGAILGMSRAEINRRFDDIVAFSELATFLDTPIKRYSTGMKTRLAFAVAAHLEPEILIIDEVLAVGDIEFQRRCLGKMNDVARSGRTILFVSHNLASVSRLCRRAIWFDSGRLRMMGGAEEILAAYQAASQPTDNGRASRLPILDGSGRIALTNVTAHVIPTANGTALTIRVRISSADDVRGLGIGVWITNDDGFMITKLSARMAGNFVDHACGDHEYTLCCPDVHRYLATGRYLLTINLNVRGHEKIIAADSICPFTVPESDRFGTGHSFGFSDGVVPVPIRIV